MVAFFGSGSHLCRSGSRFRRSGSRLLRSGSSEVSTFFSWDLVLVASAHDLGASFNTVGAAGLVTVLALADAGALITVLVLTDSFMMGGFVGSSTVTFTW